MNHIPRTYSATPYLTAVVMAVALMAGAGCEAPCERTLDCAPQLSLGGAGGSGAGGHAAGGMGAGGGAGGAGGISPTVQVAAGWGHTCARVGGEVYCWGYNEFGQLGNGSLVGSLTPKKVELSGNDGADIVLPDHFTEGTSCAAVDGEVFCWGLNSYGQLGNGSTTDSSVPAQVPGLTNVTSLSLGFGHTCALLDSGDARCWGYNNDGHLGNNSQTNSTTPVAVLTSNMNSLSCSDGHCCGMRTLGVLCWGNNNQGALGNGTTTPSTVPVPVLNLDSVVRLGSGGGHTCAVLANDEVHCWGYNEFAQLGDGTTANSSVAVNVGGLSDAQAAAVGTGWQHTCALLKDGTVRCWGGNTSGQLGNGTAADNANPQQVVGISNAVQLSVGYSHNCITTTDNKVLCWGYNGTGNLGNGNTDNASTPVEVVGLP